ncbi:NIPSNAP family protein [Undibacterium sp.]|uniref:NIPSNAP family protein n=1 Tax=Undibacterium sp. TaxID=1914977 RepID=UPI00374C9328
MKQLLIVALAAYSLCAGAQAVLAAGTTEINNNLIGKPMQTTQAFPAAPNISTEFQVIEFRRYTIKSGGREQFALYFESFFPEAFQQLGAIAFGQFFERGHPQGFTWLRGFPSMEARAIANSAFYYGQVWKEHKATLNNLIEDSDNVYLMRPLSRERGLAVLPALDPVLEPQGAGGILVAQLFAVKADQADHFSRQAEAAFASYRTAGLKEAGVLVTLDAPNNFPQLPVRSDGPYLLWLGMAQDQQMLNGVQHLLEQSARKLAETGMLVQTPELIIMDPSRRSRLRWPDSQDKQTGGRQ